MTSPQESINRHRVARRTADAIIVAHADVGATMPVSEVAGLMNNAAWGIAAGQPTSAATRALTIELLREHERSVAGVSS
jgi:hypothetical protein